jgi:hypothetical protein
MRLALIAASLSLLGAAPAHAEAANDFAVDVAMQAPSTQPGPLQIACVFEYTENDLTKSPALPEALNGMRHLD